MNKLKELLEKYDIGYKTIYDFYIKFYIAGNEFIINEFNEDSFLFQNKKITYNEFEELIENFIAYKKVRIKVLGWW